MQTAYEVPTIELEFPVALPSTFWDRFEFSFERNSKRLFTDRFHSLNTWNWHLELGDSTAQEWRAHTTHVANRAFTRSIVTSFREASVELPIRVWLEGQRGFFADLVLHSLDSADEGAVAPLDPSFRALERSWWDRLATSRDFYYGISPFRTSPYAFVSRGIRNGDTLLFLAHLRYHYNHFADHQFEIAVSVPLVDGFAIDLGTAYQFGRHEETQRMVLKLYKQFRSGGMVHLGMEMQAHPMFAVGLSLPL